MVMGILVAASLAYNFAANRVETGMHSPRASRDSMARCLALLGGRIRGRRHSLVGRARLAAFSSCEAPIDTAQRLSVDSLLRSADSWAWRCSRHP